MLHLSVSQFFSLPSKFPLNAKYHILVIHSHIDGHSDTFNFDICFISFYSSIIRKGMSRFYNRFLFDYLKNEEFSQVL